MVVNVKGLERPTGELDGSESELVTEPVCRKVTNKTFRVDTAGDFIVVNILETSGKGSCRIFQRLAPGLFGGRTGLSIPQPLPLLLQTYIPRLDSGSFFDLF